VQAPDDVPTGNSAVAQLVVQLQLSVQLAPGVTVAPPPPVHCTVWLAQVTAGFSLSATRTYEVQLAVEPPATDPTTSTEWFPGPRISDAVPSNEHKAPPPAPAEQEPASLVFTVAPHTPGEVERMAGEVGVPTHVTVMGGGVTLTENVVDDRFCRVSLAMQVTVVWPTGNVLPDGGVHVTGRLPST
jgi:hypothetical protein